MQITLELPDSLSQPETFNEADWFREIAIALFQQNRITLGRASNIAGLHQLEFQQLIAQRGICVHYEIEDLEQDLASLRQDGW